MSTQNGDDMLRSSSETAFLRKPLASPDYYVYPLTLAKKVLFDTSNTIGHPTATAVTVDTAGAEEIILSAGVIGSPQLLQLSGVGPSGLLEPLGIPVVVDLPGVGQNMQDHIFFGITRGVSATTASALGDPSFFAEQNRLFAEEATGLLTSAGVDLLAFENLTGVARDSLGRETTEYLDTFPDDWPDVEYAAFSAYFGDISVPVAADPHDGTQYATVAAVLAAPRSRGSVNLTSADATAMPTIDPRFLMDEADIEVAVAGFKRAYPGADAGDDYGSIEASIRRNFTTVYHGSCTCAMGKIDDPYAVVDPQERVYNVERLRVVDAAAFPLLPPGHIQSTVRK
ncbi:hypothetical protein Hte_005689 [Hypoxylon texense]